MLSDKEKKRRQHLKELNSLRNKMGKNLAWFDALNKTQQYDILFSWKLEKKINTLTKPETKFITKRISGFHGSQYKVLKKKIEIISYPPNLKYFIKNIKPRYSVNVSKMREAQLKILLDKC